MARCEPFITPPADTPPAALYVEVACVLSPLGEPLPTTIGPLRRRTRDVRITRAPARPSEPAHLAVKLPGGGEVTLTDARNRVPLRGAAGEPGTIVVTAFHLFDTQCALGLLCSCFEALVAPFARMGAGGARAPHSAGTCD